MAAVVLALAACDGSSDDSADDEDPAGDESLASASGIDADRQPPAAPIPGATDGGVVTGVAGGTAFQTLDPSEAYYTDSVAILSGLVTRSLTQYVYDPELDAMELIPDLATDIGTPNDDFTEWTYTIRDGVRYEDGSEVTAEDVAYGILRSFDRETFPEGPRFSNDHFVDGDTYQGPYISGTDYDGVVVDGDTLTLKMAHSFPDLPYWASFPAMGPIPASGSKPSEYWLHPLATGPYEIAAYKPGKSLRLVRNEEWDPNTDPGRHQYPDGYSFRFNVDPRTTGRVILADAPPGQTSVLYIAPDPSDVRKALAEAPDRVASAPGNCVSTLAIDYRKVPELAVRQAIGYAYPYADVIEAAGEIDGVTVEPARTLLPMGTPGRINYNPLATEPGQTDPTRARALLESAGYEPGEYEISLPLDGTDATTVAVATALEAGFNAAGFDTDAEPIASHDVYLKRRDDPNSPYNLRPLAWCTDWPTGSASLLALLSSEGAKTGGSTFSWTFFSEPAIDDEIERIGDLPLPEQPAAWGALDETIETEYYPYVVTRLLRNVILYGSRIGGMGIDGVLGMPTWKDMYVAD